MQTNSQKASSALEKNPSKSLLSSLEFLASPDEITQAFGDDKELALFFVAWLNHGMNATKAYLQIRPEVSEASARVLGCRMLRKVNISMILEAYGLDWEKYLYKLVDGLEANKWNSDVKDFEPDYKARRLYHEALGKLLGIEKNPSRDNSIVVDSYNTFNQQNNNNMFNSVGEVKEAMMQRREEKQKEKEAMLKAKEEDLIKREKELAQLSTE
jgi:hypothetical protein